MTNKEFSVRTVEMKNGSVFLIEQNLLPFTFKVVRLNTWQETANAISVMTVRGAGAIGATAGFAMAQAFLQAPAIAAEKYVLEAKKNIEATRPTARNLFYATEKVFLAGQVSVQKAVEEAQAIADKDAADSLAIGKYGNELIHENYRILTHCNAGKLAFVDHGTALSPIYVAHKEGKNIFVYADETRPRSQGARLTAWELVQTGVPHAVIPDNAAAYYMQSGQIDLVITGADRIAANGDTANKIGTLEKAICAAYYGIPFYVAAPASTFDKNTASGKDIPIEERCQSEVLFQTGPDNQGNMQTINVACPGTSALNPAFDVTPAKLITGFITEKGIIAANPEQIANL